MAPLALFVNSWIRSILLIRQFLTLGPSPSIHICLKLENRNSQYEHSCAIQTSGKFQHLQHPQNRNSQHPHKVVPLSILIRNSTLKSIYFQHLWPPQRRTTHHPHSSSSFRIFIKEQPLSPPVWARPQRRPLSCFVATSSQPPLFSKPPKLSFLWPQPSKLSNCCHELPSCSPGFLSQIAGDVTCCAVLVILKFQTAITSYFFHLKHTNVQ